MYGGKGHGVAIGFSKELLEKAVADYQNNGSVKIKANHKDCFCRLYECKYWDNKDIANYFVDNLSLNSKGEISESTPRDICSLSYIIKHPSYKFEEEWRIVFLGRSKPNELTYKELCIPLEAVEEIICGPCGDKGLIGAILPQDYRDKVKSSEINYTDTPPNIKYWNKLFKKAT